MWFCDTSSESFLYLHYFGKESFHPRIVIRMSGVFKKVKNWGFKDCTLHPCSKSKNNSFFKLLTGLRYSYILGVGTFLPILLYWKIIKKSRAAKSFTCIVLNTNLLMLYTLFYKIRNI